MTNNFHKKVHVFFKDKDTSDIVCNILENINTNDNGMVEFLFMQLTLNGYLRKIMDFFKWCYPKTWEHLTKYDQKMSYSNVPTLVGKLIWNTEVVLDLHEKILLRYATSTDFTITTVHGKPYDCSAPNLISIGGIIYIPVPIYPHIECEISYMAKHLYINGSQKVTINIDNMTDVKLEYLNYNSLYITVNGLSLLQHVPKIILKSVPMGEGVMDLPQTTDNLYLYTFGYIANGINLKAKNIHIQDTAPTKIVKVLSVIEKITTSELIVMKYLLQNIRTSNNIVKKIVYEWGNTKPLVFNQILNDYLNAGYKIIYLDENSSYIEFEMSNDDDGTI